MAALLRNNSMGTIMSGSTSTNNYGFPSGSFTHQKQPIMPSDQKAKLLAMHRDGKANAGIYVAVVLLVYFVLVTLLLCRYGKRGRRTPASEPTVDSNLEQGRFRCLGKSSVCGANGLCKCLSRIFCRRRCSSQADNITARSMALTHNLDCEKDTRGALKLAKEDEVRSMVNEMEQQNLKCQGTPCHPSAAITTCGDGDEENKQSFGMISTDTTTGDDSQHQNDSSTEED